MPEKDRKNIFGRIKEFVLGIPETKTMKQIREKLGFALGGQEQIDQIVEYVKNGGKYQSYPLENLDVGLHKALFLRLIDSDYGGATLNYMEKCQGLDSEVANRLIDKGRRWGWYVVQHLERFQGLDHNQIALRLIAAGMAYEVSKKILYFRKLSSEVAKAFIEADLGWRVAQHFDRFEGMAPLEFVSTLMAKGQGWALAGFEGLPLNETFGLLVKEDPGAALLFHKGNPGIPDADQQVSDSLTRNILSLAPDLKESGAHMQAKAILMSCKGVEKQFGGTLSRLGPLLKRRPDLWSELIYPTVMSQKSMSFHCLEEIVDLFGKAPNVDEKKVGLVKFITTQTGVRASDLLENFILQGIRDGHIKDFSEESELLREFIQSGAIVLTEIYEGWRLAKEQGKPELYLEIVKVTKVLQKKIAEGACDAEDFNNRFFLGITMHTFPPAASAGRRNYKNLIGEREGRQDDVPKSLDNLQNHAISISSGGYKLKEGEELDTRAWNSLLKSVEEGKRAGSKKLEESGYGDIGKELCLTFSEGKLKTEQEKFLGLLYRVYQGRGQSLPESLSGHRELMAYKEYVGDTLNDLIGLLLQAWEKEDPKSFETWQKTETQKRTKDVKGLAKQIAGVLKNEKMDEAKKTEVLKNILARAEFQAEGDIVKTLTDELEKGNLEEFLKSKLEGKGNAQKFNLLIKNALFGKEYSQMYGEMQKYEFAEGAEKQEYKLFVSKKKEHGCAGLNMGVCVAPDKKLWNNPNFMNVIAMKDGIAYGGMHFLVVEHEGKKYLTLPGINPNEALLGQAAAEPLFDALMDYAQRCAKAVGCEKVLIPKATVIHSNRSAIQEIIASRNYPTFDFGEEVPFSYDPYQYSFQECYEIKTPHQRCQLLLEDANKRLQEIEKLNLKNAENEAKIEWLKLRIFEIQTILTLVINFEEESQEEEIQSIDEENRRIVPGRILELEKNPWSAGNHGDHAETKPPKIQP